MRAIHHDRDEQGLELQETSCHTEEATAIDTMFQLAFEDESHVWLQRNKVRECE